MLSKCCSQEAMLDARWNLRLKCQLCLRRHRLARPRADTQGQQSLHTEFVRVNAITLRKIRTACAPTSMANSAPSTCGTWPSKHAPRVHSAHQSNRWCASRTKKALASGSPKKALKPPAPPSKGNSFSEASTEAETAAACQCRDTNDASWLLQAS